jgi:hypothetical protein
MGDVTRVLSIYRAAQSGEIAGSGVPSKQHRESLRSAIFPRYPNPPEMPILVFLPLSELSDLTVFRSQNKEQSRTQRKSYVMATWRGLEEALETRSDSAHPDIQQQCVSHYQASRALDNDFLLNPGTEDRKGVVVLLKYGRRAVQDSEARVFAV